MLTVTFSFLTLSCFEAIFRFDSSILKDVQQRCIVCQ